MDTKELRRLLSAPFTSSIYDDMIAYLEELYPDTMWMIYPETSIQDIRDTFFGVLFAESNLERQLFIQNMITFYQHRINRYNREVNKINRNMYKQHQNNHHTRADCANAVNNPEKTYLLLTWLDALVEQRKYQTGIMKYQMEIDKWLLVWLNKAKDSDMKASVFSERSNETNEQNASTM